MVESSIETNCAICMLIMVEPATLECKHSFCIICIVKVFNNKRECPMCRHAIPEGEQKLAKDLASLI